MRKVYNLALAARNDAWARGERVNYAQTSALLTAWKQSEELSYLTEVSCVPLGQALRHLQSAFTAFWGRRSGYPRFKAKRRSRASAEYTRSAFRYRNGELTLAKMPDPLPIVWSRRLAEGAEPTTATVSRDSAGRWFVSLLCEDNPAPMPATTATVGIDAGLTALVTPGSAVSACRADGRPPGDPPGRRSAVKQDNPPAWVGTVPSKGHGEAKQPR